MSVALVQLPVAAYLFSVHADWTLMYAADPRSLSVASLVLMPLVVAALPAVGYLGGWALIRWRGRRAAALALLAGGALLILVLVLGRARIFVYGNYAGFRRGDTVPLVETKLFLVLVVLAAGSGAAAWFAARTIRAEGWRKGAAEIAASPRSRRGA